MTITEAIKLASPNAINLLSDDTDVSVLLMYHWTPFMCDIYFSTEKRVKKKEIQKQWNIQYGMATHGISTHAWSGCDTTSATYLKGKLNVWHLLHI